MHYFSIHTLDGGHLGFLIMLPDDESENPPQNGRFAVKLQSETPPPETAAVRALAACENAAAPLYWTLAKDHVALFDADGPIGRIRGEHLMLAADTLLLNDLTGTL